MPKSDGAGLWNMGMGFENFPALQDVADAARAVLAP